MLKRKNLDLQLSRNAPCINYMAKTVMVILRIPCAIGRMIMSEDYEDFGSSQFYTSSYKVGSRYSKIAASGGMIKSSLIFFLLCRCVHNCMAMVVEKTSDIERCQKECDLSKRIKEEIENFTKRI